MDAPQRRRIDGDPVDDIARAAVQDEPLRRGSPFRDRSESAVDKAAGDGPSSGEVDPSSQPGSPFRHVDDEPEWTPDAGLRTAAVFSSLVVLGFVIACWAVFPGGGVVVASLGCGLAVIGLFSRRRFAAAMLLSGHAAGFFACYVQVLG